MVNLYVLSHVKYSPGYMHLNGSIHCNVSFNGSDM